MLAFSLAEQLGMTVENLLTEMSLEEYLHWIAYRQIQQEQGQKQSSKSRAKKAIKGVIA